MALMEGIGTRTTASHTCSFGSADNSYVFRMMKLFKKSGINFISCPTENVYLEGRQDTYPKRRGITRVTTYDKDLYEKTLKEDAREEGREEGRQEGRQQGLAEGLEQGKQEKNIENARTMKALNISSEVIQQVTGLAIKDIEEL